MKTEAAQNPLVSPPRYCLPPPRMIDRLLPRCRMGCRIRLHLAVAGMSAHAFAAIRAHTFNNQSDAR